MDAKITLSFDAQIVERAKEYADSRGISLSRLTEVLFRRLTAGGYVNIEDFPVSNWVHLLSEGEASYVKTPKSSKALRTEHHASKKKKA
jgi:hypothetical protein